MAEGKVQWRWEEIHGRGNMYPECELFVKNPVQQIFTVLKNEFFYQSFSNFHCSFNRTSNFFKVDRIPGVQLQIVENNQNHG